MQSSVSSGSGDDGGDSWSVATFESYVSDVHESNMEESHLSGSDALLDNHFGRRLGNSGAVLDGTTAKLDEQGNMYRLWQQTNENVSPPSVGHFLYAVAPAGNAVQIVGNFDDTPWGIEEWSSCIV